MSLAADILERLRTTGGITDLVGQRSFDKLAPRDVTSPYITIDVQTPTRYVDLSGTGGLARSSLNVTLWNEAGGGLDTLRAAVISDLGNIINEDIGGSKVQHCVFRGASESAGIPADGGVVPVDAVVLSFEVWHEE